MNDAAFLRRFQRAGHLRHHLQRVFYWQGPQAPDSLSQGLSLHQFHRIKALVVLSDSIVQHAGHVRIPQSGGSARFSEKTFSISFPCGRFAVNDFQGDRRVKVCIKRFVSDAH